jgi:thioredoxin 1
VFPRRWLRISRAGWKAKALWWRSNDGEKTMSKPIPVTDETFEAEVIQAAVPVLTDFWANWCAPCHIIAPVLEEIAAEYAGQLKVAKLDVDSNPRTAMQFGVMSIPTSILFKNGQAVERLVGAMPKRTLLARITPHL